MCLRGSYYYSDGFSVFLLAFYNTKKQFLLVIYLKKKKKWIIHYLCIHTYAWMILQFYFDIFIPHTCIRLGQTGLFSGTAGSPGSVWAPEHGSTGVDVSSGHQMGQRYRLEGGNIETEMLHKPRDANMLHCENAIKLHYGWLNLLCSCVYPAHHLEVQWQKAFVTVLLSSCRLITKPFSDRGFLIAV